MYWDGCETDFALEKTAQLRVRALLPLDPHAYL